MALLRIVFGQHITSLETWSSVRTGSQNNEENICSQIRVGMVSFNNQSFIHINRAAHFTVAIARNLCWMQLWFIHTALGSSLRNADGHVKSEERKFICRNSLGMLARFRSVQL